MMLTVLFCILLGVLKHVCAVPVLDSDTATDAGTLSAELMARDYPPAGNGWDDSPRTNNDDFDVWDCNIRNAPEQEGLAVWGWDDYYKRMIQPSGVNLRFDFKTNDQKDPATGQVDNGHACVALSIREATCKTTDQNFGLRCLPILWEALPGDDQMDETPVPPDECRKSSLMPPDAL
ncbi:hypothetical protein F5Y18DRAFT_426481 [Xylariaceae sp. FL1019]|nr:hypothetical protein F5Y18DRAFT_426481 [Xylariaceae sp. FL1019]